MRIPSSEFNLAQMIRTNIYLLTKMSAIDFKLYLAHPLVAAHAPSGACGLHFGSPWCELMLQALTLKNGNILTRFNNKVLQIAEPLKENLDRVFNRLAWKCHGFTWWSLFCCQLLSCVGIQFRISNGITTRLLDYSTREGSLC